MRKINAVLNTVMGCTAGVFLGYGCYTVWDYHTRPELYRMQSVPWYTGILLYGAVAAAILLGGAALKLVIRKCGKK